MLSRRVAIFMLLAATAAWGLSFPCGKALMRALEEAMPGRSSWFYSSLVMGGRFALGALILLMVHPRALAKARASEWRQGIGLGVFGGLGMLLQADGLNHTAASTSAFLTQFTAVLVPVAVAFRDRRLPSAFTVGCILMVMAGCALLGQFDLAELRIGRGEAETLLGTAFFTAQILWLEIPIFRGNHAGRVTLIMFGTIAMVLLPVYGAHAQSWSDARVLWHSMPMLVVFVAMTLLCSLLAFLLMNRWQPCVDATTAGVIYCAEPLFATALALALPAWLAPLLGIAYENESFTRHLVIGGTLITLANVLVVLRPVRGAADG